MVCGYAFALSPAERLDYKPQGDAYFAYLALHDPIRPDDDGWVQWQNVKAQSGSTPGSDTADYEAGLVELVDRGWAEVREGDSLYTTAWRLTPTGSVLRTRLGLT